jgi:hypothetical protein
MCYRKAAWITFLTCGLVLLFIWAISPVLWSEVVYTLCFYTAHVAVPLGFGAGVYLLVVYLVWWLRKSRGGTGSEEYVEPQ